MNIDPLLTAEKTAEALGVSVEMVYKIIRQGVLPAVRIGTAVRILPVDLDQFIAASRTTDPRPQKKRIPKQQSRYMAMDLVDPQDTGQ